MGIVKAATGTWNLKCHSPYPVHSIQSIHMERKAGGHARLFLTAVLPEEQQDREIDMTANGENISLIETGERGQEIRKLFQGIIQEVGVRDVQGVYILELEAVSYSYLLDIEPRIRSFQHSEMECEDVIRQVLSAYPKSDLIDYVSSGTKLGGLTVQYRETDWQFLRRIASRFGAVVIPEVTADAPKLYFGVPDGGYHELKDQNYTVTRDLHALKMSWSAGAADVREADFTSYRVQTRRWFGLGDTVQFQGQELRVAAAESRLMQGMLIHTYTLSPHSGIRENEIRNDELAGASLEGKILAVKKDTVKVHLDVDATQAEHEASWMPYSAVYASDGGGFYCMPQAGDSVQVYFGSGREQDAFAMGSVRRGSSPSPKTADPATKSWGTNFGKEMRMTDAEMSLIATEGSLFITLDDGGISITSNSGIQMNTVQDLVLDSEKSIEIEAKEILFLQCGDSSLVLDGMSDLRGSSLTMNGIIKLPVQVEDLEPQYEAPFVSEVAVPEEAAPEEQPKKKKKGFWSKVLDVSQTVLDVAGLIPGVGEIADLANAGIYALRGDYTSALLSVGASVPFAGWGPTGVKLGNKVRRVLQKIDLAGQASKAYGAIKTVASKGADVAKAIGRIADTAGDALNAGLGKVLTKAKKLASNVSAFDLAGKLKSGMNTLLEKHSKLKKVLHLAGGMGVNYLATLAMGSGVDALSEHADSNIVKAAVFTLSMLMGRSRLKKGKGGGSKGTGEGDKRANESYDYRKVNKQTNDIGETLATKKQVKQFKEKWGQLGIPVKMDKKGKVLTGNHEAAFDYGKGRIFIKKNPTVVNIYHEGYHAEQWLGIGKDAYMKLSRLDREEYVFEQIMKNQHLFDDASIKHSIEYINRLRLKFK
ncbi:zincin-like metallopeptidase toxin domain-containing protein [Paenibacillus sp. FSL M7-1046]|uniref:zincin-like metallopeptidase toxin domain-containing protein n=1 Tax=Paenibacillus sp. FSL M7-1046 TaxID=2975315 RepID=UPI0030FB8DAA